MSAPTADDLRALRARLFDKDLTTIAKANRADDYSRAVHAASLLVNLQSWWLDRGHYSRDDLDVINVVIRQAKDARRKGWR